MKKILSLLILSWLLLPLNFVLAVASQEEINALNQDISAKTDLVNSLDEKIRVYEESIRTKNEEKANLQSQVSVLEDNINKTETEIAKSETEISRLSSEIKLVKSKIGETETEIGDKQTQISSYILDLYRSDQKTNLEILLNNDNLSEYFTNVEYAEKLQSELQKNVNQLQSLKDELKIQKNELDTKKQDETQKKTNLGVQHSSLEGEKTFKNSLLDQVAGDEQKFQELLQRVKAEDAAVEAQIAALEKQMRSKIDNGEPLTDTDNGTFVMPSSFQPGWPTTSRYITCGWHCPDYFVGYVHSAIDISTPQGSSIYAADSGVVLRAVHDGSNSYSWVMIGHADGYATVYGHLSAVYVQADQTVTKGQVIGLSGGMPGTEGAGWMTTGPHLHFEVRLNGIPVNPSEYLP